MEPADVVLRFLECVGSKRESEFYLALFRAGAPERFAAISVDANVARHALEAVTLDLGFLAALGLFPVVVLGLFESTEAMEHAVRLTRKLERNAVPALLLGAHEPDVVARATEAMRSGRIPVLAFPVTGEATRARFEHLGALVGAWQTRKLIFLHRPGGLRQKGELVPLVNLTTDYDALAGSRELSRKEHLLLDEARRLVLHSVAHKLLVAITSPLNLFRELFTIKGAGTLLRRGAVITRRDGYEALDRERLRALLSAAFGRPPADDFFERPVSRVYLEESYRGAAIVCATPLGGYLSKFAVDVEAQGEGMGRDLWRTMAADWPTLFWRARARNPIDAWYDKLCDGMMRFAEWHVYWKGLDAAQVPAAVEYALGQPRDFRASADMP